MDAALLFPVALVLAGMFLWSVHTVGRWVVEVLRLQVSDSQAARLAAGLTVYAAAGVALGSLNLYRWPLVLAAAVGPGLIAVRRGVTALREAATELRGMTVGVRPDPVWVSGGLVAAIYLAVAVAPSFHYDLLVNYLGVPKDYLIRGDLAALPHNIHSSLSLALHVLIGYPLALSELLNRSEFLFGTASVWGALHLIVIIATGRRLQLLAGALIADRGIARQAGWTALALWLTMPQTLLLALLENAEFLTTYLGVAIAGVAIGGRRRDDPLIVGALCGLLVASKPQSAIFAAAALGIVVIPRWRSWRSLAALAAAGLLPAAAMLRSAIVFGGFFFPYRPGAGPEAEAARALLAENAVSLPESLGALVGRITAVATLEPETGVTLVIIVLVLLGRVRSPRFWALAAAALATPLLTSANATNTLRWVQPGLLMLLLAAAINLVELAPQRGPVRWATAAFLAASLVLSVSFVVRTTGPFPHLVMTEDAFLAERIPTFEVRRGLMRRSGNVLWMGELYGYYGAAKGPIPAPQNGAYFSRFLGAGSPEEIRGRLTAGGYGWISLCRLHRATAPGTGHWSWMTAGDVRAVEGLLAGLPAEHPMNGVAVYRVTLPEAPPGSSR